MSQAISQSGKYIQYLLPHMPALVKKRTLVEVLIRRPSGVAPEERPVRYSVICFHRYSESLWTYHLEIKLHFAPLIVRNAEKNPSNLQEGVHASRCSASRL